MATPLEQSIFDVIQKTSQKFIDDWREQANKMLAAWTDTMNANLNEWRKDAEKCRKFTDHNKTLDQQ